MLPRIVFMGSPDFAVPSLQALAQHYPVVGAITQPDRPSGRGQRTSPCAVKMAALGLQIPVASPAKLRDPAALAQLQAWQPDLIVVVAYGQILRPAVLALPRWGCLNVHASLLPRWRGAAPVQAALLAGDNETGVTIMQLDSGVDTGPTLARQPMPIRPDHTAGSLSDELATLGANLLMQTLPSYLMGTLTPQPQPNAGGCYAPMLQKNAGQIDWQLPAAQLALQIRAYNPWPSSFTTWQAQPFKIHQTVALAGQSEPGLVTRQNGLVVVGTAAGLLSLRTVQAAGKKALPIDDFLRGNPHFIGSILGTTPALPTD
jgi:methionyl-tRNA formyltransferase